MPLGRYCLLPLPYENDALFNLRIEDSKARKPKFFISQDFLTDENISKSLYSLEGPLIKLDGRFASGTMQRISAEKPPPPWRDSWERGKQNEGWGHWERVGRANGEHSSGQSTRQEWITDLCCKMTPDG